MRWISSTRKFKNRIERLWKRIHGPKVTVMQVQQNGPGQNQSNLIPRAERDRSIQPGDAVSAPAWTLTKPFTASIGTPRKGVGNSSRGSGRRDATPNHLPSNSLELWRKRHERKGVHATDNNSLGNIRAVQKMPHGHQAHWYRKSVKANVKPEEDEVS